MAGFPSLVLVCTVLVGNQVAAELACITSNSSEIRVTFDSHRNKTGRWTHEIGLEHPDLPSGPNHDKNTVPWTVDVKYLPRKCDDKLKDSLKVLISFSERQHVASDYLHIPGLGYYKYYSTQVTWPVAKATCEQDGAHLAIINSLQEADALKKLVVNSSKDWVWLGVVKSETKGEFVTVLGDSLSFAGLTQLYSLNVNAPPNSSAVINKASGTFSYDTAPTKTTYVFICEQEY